ncbi:MAG: NUDIX hydrolase [Phyllobacterium sp.]
MDGLSKNTLDSVTRHEERTPSAPERPRDAATLLLLDRKDGEFRVLMGRRHMRHVFMPGKFVFPGGRTDAGDGGIVAARELNEKDEAKLLLGMGAKATRRRARALALSAIRETYEEAGLLLGSEARRTSSHPDWEAFSTRNISPDLSRLRFVARAITPPGRIRRFDTRFFIAFRDAIACALPDGTGPSGELEELHWLALREAANLDVPPITLAIIREVEQLLADDPALDRNYPVVQYAMKHGRYVREVI